MQKLHTLKMAKPADVSNKTIICTSLLLLQNLPTIKKGVQNFTNKGLIEQGK